jgi:hypothetical protein
MRGVDEGNERRTTYTEKEEGGREREKERGDDRANVPVSVHAAPGAQHLAPTQEACLCYS